MSSTAVSVIIPFFDAASYLDEALDSIACQTYRDIEILAIDDGSTDGSRAIVERFADRDSRFRLLANNYDKGIVGALNTGLDHARGTYVARMDADDVAVQNRLAAQVKFLETQPEIGLCGTFVRTFGATTPTTWALPTDHADIKATMLFHGAIAHPSVMLRRATFERANLRYDQDFLFAEDLELWERASQTIAFANVPRILMRYRVNSAGVTAVHRGVQLSRTEQILRRAVARLGVEPTAEEWQLHLDIANHHVILGEERVATARRWFDRMIEANSRSRTYDRNSLQKLLDSKTGAFRGAVIPLDRIPLQNGIARRARTLVKRATPARSHKTLASIYRSLGHSYVVAEQTLRRKLKAVSKTRGLSIGMAVLVHERPEYLRKCLDSLFASNIADFDIRFFLVDDGSSDPQVRKIVMEPRPKEYRIERHFLPRGPGTAGAAINRALELMLGSGDFDIIGWSDPDALYHPDWLTNMLKVCLWARENHRRDVLGPFCCFNSSDEEYHKVLGRYVSPYGGYVVKRQMGMLNYFFFKSDMERVGFFDEGPNDETLMTERLERASVRNFCTFNSYVEHLGQVSSLARWRPSGLSKAVHGLHLAPGRWPEALKTADTIGYFSDVIGLPAQEPSSDVPVDVVYVATDRDIETISLSLESVRLNLLQPIKEVLVIGPSKSEIGSLAKSIGARFVCEDELLSFQKRDIRYVVDGVARDGWLFQQLLKFAATKLVGADRYLVIDADTILVRPQAFTRPNADVLFHSNEFHAPYVEAYCRLTKEAPKTMLSFVNHHMMFNVERVRGLLAHSSELAGVDWPLAVLNAADMGSASGFSEYLTYGLWCLERYESSTVREYGFNKGLPRSRLTSLDNLMKGYGKRYRSVSLHWYDQR
jgi:glycosyltransferase involved in cell wall biosynthesis